MISKAFGYTAEELSSVPAHANMGLSCGNTVSIANLKPGETVVDLGSGGGLDCFLAAKKVGETGKVVGIDMTQEMVDLARRNAEKGGYGNVTFELVKVGCQPYDTNQRFAEVEVQSFGGKNEMLVLEA